MSNLLTQIRSAQVRAGEDAVIRHLEAQGLDRPPAEPEAAKVTAIWSISLDAECPGCGEDVDLLEHAEFWNGAPIDPIETCTPRSKNLDVACPKCNHKFKVNCEY